MSDEIRIDDSAYVTASAASQACGVTREYVSRLCKEGKADAKLINGQWFVSVPSLTTHLALQKLALAEQRRARAQLLHTEYRRHTRPYAHRAIQAAHILWSHRILASLAIVSIFYTSSLLTYKPPAANAATTVTFLTSGTTYAVPSDWNSSDNFIEVIGGGAGGATGNGSTSQKGGGGGGGGYSKSTNVTLTPSSSVTIAVGSGGTSDTNGTDTYLCNSTSNCASIVGSAVQVGAKGGSTGGYAVGGSGGSSASGIGSTKYSGGNGSADGGGAGAAGLNGAGNNGSGTGVGGSGDAGSGGAGGAVGTNTPGGSGGNGTEWDASHGSGGGGGLGGEDGQPIGGLPGGTGGLYGGGGGGGLGYPGGCSPGAGGAGRQGLIVLTYTPASGPSGGTVFLLGMPF